MRVTWARQALPTDQASAIFLAGPTPRETGVQSWRREALAFLEKIGYPYDVFVPEHEDPNRPFSDWEDPEKSYADQVAWEEQALNRADVILFWIPREMKKMPALTTNNEFGFWCARDPLKVVLGTPPDADKVRYQRHQAASLGIPVKDDLEATIVAALDKIQAPSVRYGGECDVPLHIWKTESFQRWFVAQASAGNRVDGAKVLWVYNVGKGYTFAWALKMNVFVREENRNKTNEFVLSRTDISSVLAYHRPASLDSHHMLDTKVVLVREFRSPSSNHEGFVWELPGGSSPKPNQIPHEVASHELSEETSLKIPPDRFKILPARQLAATWSAHKCHLFKVELTAAEITHLEKLEEEGKPFGVLGDSEMTYVKVRTVQEILDQRLVDFATLGMILEGLRWLV